MDETNLEDCAVLDDLRHKLSESKGKMTKLLFEVWRLIRLNYTKYNFFLFFFVGAKLSLREIGRLRLKGWKAGCCTECLKVKGKNFQVEEDSCTEH